MTNKQRFPAIAIGTGIEPAFYDSVERQLVLVSGSVLPPVANALHPVYKKAS